MKQTWLLSCLGSLGKRKKTFEGKLNAMFSKETSGASAGGKSTIAAACTASTAAAAVGMPTVTDAFPCPHQEPTTGPPASPLETSVTPATQPQADTAEKIAAIKEKQTLGGRLIKIAKRRRVVKKADAKKKLLFVDTAKRQEIVADARVSAKGTVSARVSKKYL